MLADLGCIVSDSDALARQALLDPSVKQTILNWWGDRVVNKSGELDRAAIAEIVFEDTQQRKRLEQLTHPWIEARRLEAFAAAPATAPALVIDAPLLFEAGLHEKCEAVIFVDASPQVRQQRVLATRGWTPRQLAQRQDSQWPLDLKRSRADYVLQNDGDFSDLEAQVRRVLSSIVNKRRRVK